MHECAATSLYEASLFFNTGTRYAWIPNIQEREKRHARIPMSCEERPTKNMPQKFLKGWDTSLSIAVDISNVIF